MTFTEKIRKSTSRILLEIFLTIFVISSCVNAENITILTSKIDAEMDSSTGIFNRLNLRDTRFDNQIILDPVLLKTFSDKVQPYSFSFMQSTVTGEIQPGSTTVDSENDKTVITTTNIVRFHEIDTLEIQRRLIFNDSNYIFDMELTISNITDDPFGPFSAILSIGPGITDNTFENSGIFKIDQMYKRMPFSKKQETRVYNEPMDVCGIMTNYYAMIVSVKSGAEKYGFTFERLDAPEDVEEKMFGGAGHLNIHVNKTIASRESHKISFESLIGPMFGEELVNINGEGLVDLGFFSGIASFLLHIMTMLKNFTGSWGLAIILLTLLVRAVLHPLNVKQIRSMKEMQKIQPKVNSLREKYKNDPQKLNVETMQLYKEHKINPLSGCLPMIFQLPILFALFSVLRSNVELKGVSFLWIKDLAVPEIIMMGGQEYHFPLLALMVAFSMWWQQKTMGNTAPEQQTMMFMMPIIMFMISRNLASGLLLYWFISNLLSAVTQKYARSHMEPEFVTGKVERGKKSKKQKSED